MTSTPRSQPSLPASPVPLPSDPQLRVLFVSHTFPPEDHPPAVGGMQRVSIELHEALQEMRGVALRSVLLRSRRPWLAFRVVPFILSLLWRLPRQARRHDTDVVVFSSMVTAMLTWPLARWFRASGIKTAAIVHGLDATNTFPTYQWIVRRVLASLDLVLPVSHSTAALCIARGARADTVEVVPNGVSISRFFPNYFGGSVGGDGCGFVPVALALNGRKEVSRQQLADRFRAPELLDENVLLVCSVGRQIPRKGFDWFAREVMPLLPSDVHYWLAGDGPQSTAIREAAIEAGVEHRVRLLGQIDEETLTTLLRAADIFAMPNLPTPNDPEGFGVVMLEAGLCGTPTVAASLEGIRDVIADGTNGHLVSSGDATGFAATILRYHRDRSSLDHLVRRAVEHTAVTFEWSSVALRYAQILSHHALPADHAETLQPVFSPTHLPELSYPLPAWASAPAPSSA